MVLKTKYNYADETIVYLARVDPGTRVKEILKVFWSPSYQQMVAKVRMEACIHIDELLDWYKQPFDKRCTQAQLFAVVKYVPLADLINSSSSLFINHLTNLLEARKQIH